MQILAPLILLFVASHTVCSAHEFQSSTYARGAEFEYQIARRQLLARRLDSNDEWSPQGGVGIPFEEKTLQPIDGIGELEQVFADADQIAVIDSKNQVYLYQSDTSVIGPKEPYAWHAVWGAPSPVAFFFDRKFRAVSFSRHTDESIGYIQDALGIAHLAGGASYLVNFHKEKKGKSGLTHFYAISEEGSRLFFADTGLPTGIHYEYPLPEKRIGNPIGIASRGSTVAILTDKGEVFTKMLDFDFLGHNPMMYQYRYNSKSLIDELSHFSFTELTPSHFGTVNLPYGDWLKHEVKVAGVTTEQLMLGTEIDMQTTGKGSFNRLVLLRYQTKSGVCGVLSKNLNTKPSENPEIQNWENTPSKNCPDRTIEITSVKDESFVSKKEFNYE